MEFKTYKEGPLYCYLSVTSPLAAQAVPGGISAGETIRHAGGDDKRLAQYIQLAADLSIGKNLWVMIRETPESINHFGHLQPTRISWKYDLIANDTEGLGVDKGFVPVQDSDSPLHTEQGQAILLLQLPELAPLLDLSEDLLGDVASQITLLALQGEENEVVEEFQNKNNPPQLENLLKENDLFINLTIGKEQGYYDTFLMKAGQDLTEELSRLTA